MAGGTDYCNPEALLAFASSAESIGDSIDGFLGRLDSARVDQGAFGRMPFIGDRIYQAYDDHVDETKLGITESKSALQGAGAGAAMSAAEWLKAESTTIEGVSEVGQPG